jgi:hypothetical protein
MPSVPQASCQPHHPCPCTLSMWLLEDKDGACCHHELRAQHTKSSSAPKAHQKRPPPPRQPPTTSSPAHQVTITSYTRKLDTFIDTRTQNARTQYSTHVASSPLSVQDQRPSDLSRTRAVSSNTNTQKLGKISRTRTPPSSPGLINTIASTRHEWDTISSHSQHPVHPTAEGLPQHQVDTMPHHGSPLSPQHPHKHGYLKAL